MTAVSLVAANVLIVAGMACQAWAMPHHHEMLGRAQPDSTVRTGVRALGWLLLLVAILPCVAGWGGAIGLVLWIGLLSAGVLVVAGWLTVLGVRQRPRSGALGCRPEW